MKLMINYKKSFLNRFRQNKLVAIDTETYSLKDRTMVGFSIAFNDKQKIAAYYIPVRDEYLDNMPMTKAKNLLNYILKNCHVIFHNASFDIPVLQDFGIDCSKIHVDDTLIMSHLVNENMQHGLKKLVKKYFDYEMQEYKDVCGTGKKQVGFYQVESLDKINYAADDALYTYKLYKVLLDYLKNDSKIFKVYTEIEKPLLLVVADMHTNGIKINVKKIMDIAKICKNKIDLDEAKLRLTMGKMNFGSTKQLREYFIDKRHMPIIKTSEKTANPSVDKEVLEKYSETNSEARILLEFRKYSKIYSTFIPALTPQYWDAETMLGSIYASFNQAGTVSGRFSSSRPNMQNMPREEKYLPDGSLNSKYLGIREAIIPDKGHILIGADYSQIELRVLAHFSQDKNLIEAYSKNKDIHQQTADACGVARQEAKTINFGLVYGMRNRMLAKQIKVSAAEAQQYINKYFNTYPGVKDFWMAAEKTFRDTGYVSTISGRKRRKSKYFHVKDDYDQGAEVRSAINSIIQGTAADLIKVAMVSMYPQLKTLGARIISTVHDEILVSCPIKNAKECYIIVLSCMLKAGECLSVPIKVDCKFGRTWAEAHGDGVKLKELDAQKQSN